MKYKINLTGYGEELIIASVTEEFFKHFKENGISFNDYMSGEMEDELPEHLLEVYNEDRRYEADDVLHTSGAYYDDSVYINVVDEDGNEIYSENVCSLSDGDSDGHFVDLVVDVDTLDCEHRYVVIGHEYSRGFQDEFELELDSEVFDPKKITILYKCYDECVDLICGIKYGDVELESNGELDTRGKGADWSIRDNENPLIEI